MEKKNLKTGIFGGSYNPIHIGHLALANYLCEFGDLDEIWFMVSPQNPFKKNQQMLDDHFRLEMVEAAIILKHDCFWANICCNPRDV